MNIHNKTNCIKAILLLTVLIFFNKRAFSQSPYAFHSVASPSANSMIYSDFFQLDSYTGKAQINVPLYTMESKGMSLPIGLNYDSGGIRVNDPNGWVGQNFHLLSGGVITRQVNGHEDENSKRFYSYFEIATDAFLIEEGLNTNSKAIAGTNYKYEQVKNNNFVYVDTEPDVFSFNMFGLSGKFFLGTDGEWKVISDNNIKVEFDVENSDNFQPSLHERIPYSVSSDQKYADVIKGFVLIDELGNRYTFGKDENAIEYSLSYFHQAITDPEFLEDWVASAWYLTEVQNVNSEVLFSFSYERGKYIANFIQAEGNRMDECALEVGSTTSYDEFLAIPWEGVDGHLLSPCYILEVENFYSEKINFNSTDSPQLNYKYEDLMQEEHEKAYIQNEAYLQFPYLSDPFYNDLAHPNTGNDIFTNSLLGLKWRKLDDINITRNGEQYRNIEFQYEDLPDKRLFLSTVKIANSLNGSDKLVYKFEYNEKNNLPKFLSKKIDHFGYILPFDYSFNFYLPQDKQGYSNLQDEHYNSREPKIFSSKKGSLKKLIYPTGGFSKFHYELNDYGSVVSDDRQSILNETGETSGLRVSKIELYDDPLSNMPKSTRTYKYVIGYGGANVGSSGVLAVKPKYSFIDQQRTTTVGEFKTTLFSTHNLSPLGNLFESYIGYSEVAEVFDNGSYNVYSYTTHKDYKDELPIFDLNIFESPYEKFTDRSSLRGKLLNKTTYDSSNNPVTRISNVYRSSIRVEDSESYSIVFDGESATGCYNSVPQGELQIIYEGSVRKLYYYKDYLEKSIYENFRNGYLRQVTANTFEVNINYGNEYAFLTSSTTSSGDDSRTTHYTYPKDYDFSYNEILDKHMINTPITTSINGGAGGGSKVDYNLGNVIVPLKYYAQRDDGSWKEVQELKYDNFNDTYPDRIKEIGRAYDLHLSWGSGAKLGLLEQMRYQLRIWDYQYNSLRQLESITDYNDIKSTFTYDGLNRLLSKSTNNGRIRNEYTFNYGLIDGGENLVTDELIGQDGTGFLTKMNYDGLGREIVNTKEGFLDGGGDYVMTTKYDNLGRVEEVTDPGSGGASKNIYEKSPLTVIEKVFPAGSPRPVQMKHSIEENKFVVTTIDEDQIESKTFTDIFGRQRKTIDGMGSPTIYEYNDRDQVLTIDPPGGSANYSYTYFPDGKLLSKFIPDKGDFGYTYNNYDQVLTESLANGKMISNNYHALYNNFLMSRVMDGELLEEYIPEDLTYTQDFIKEEKYSIHFSTGSGEAILGQKHEVKNVDIDKDFGRVLHQNVKTLDGEYTLEFGYDDLGNMKSKTSTVHAFDNVKVSSESWVYPKGLRQQRYSFNVGADGLSGGSFLRYNENDWLENKKLGDVIQSINYEYNPRGWLKKINPVSGVQGGGLGNCDEPDIPPNPEFDCESLLTIIQSFIIQYDCEDLNNGNPTVINIDVTHQEFDNGQRMNVDFETITIPINGGNENTVLHDEYDFNLNGETSVDDVAGGIYNVLLDCIENNPELLNILESMILSGLENNLNNVALALGEEPGPGTSTPPGAPVFGMEMFYYEGNNELQARPRYNGNISWMKWKAIGEDVHNYGFNYDDNNRLTRAIYGEVKFSRDCAIIKTDKYSVPEISYDELGNIQTLQRRGLLNPEATTDYEYGVIDALEYKYDESPNVVNSIKEDADVEKGFIGSRSIYNYDPTGNMTYASNKTLNSEYSYHDLPLRMSTIDGTVSNFYTSTGIKLKSVVIPLSNGPSEPPTITNYFDKQEYINGKIFNVYFEEGRATYYDDKQYIEYFLKDHLGNTRVRIADLNGDDNVQFEINNPEKDEVMSTHHYYPFGMEWDVPSRDRGGNSLEPTGFKSKYTYNGKEHIDDLGINLSDYGFRQYDPAVARWTSIDPLAERYHSISPNAYVANNPINAIDPDGARILFVNGYWNSWIGGMIGSSSPGKSYWGRGFTGAAQKFFEDRSSVSDRNYIDGSSMFGGDSSGGGRKKSGYNYAKKNYNSLVEGLKEDESFNIVTHSEGGAFGAGIAEYLIEQGHTVAKMVHLSTDEGDEFDNPISSQTYQLSYGGDWVTGNKEIRSGVDVLAVVDKFSANSDKRKYAHGSTKGAGVFRELKSLIQAAATGATGVNVTESSRGVKFEFIRLNWDN